jgi:hypothetical protein
MLIDVINGVERARGQELRLAAVGQRPLQEGEDLAAPAGKCSPLDDPAAAARPKPRGLVLDRLEHPVGVLARVSSLI